MKIHLRRVHAVSSIFAVGLQRFAGFILVATLVLHSTGCEGITHYPTNYPNMINGVHRIEQLGPWIAKQTDAKRIMRGTDAAAFWAYRDRDDTQKALQIYRDVCRRLEAGWEGLEQGSYKYGKVLNIDELHESLLENAYYQLRSLICSGDRAIEDAELRAELEAGYESVKPPKSLPNAVALWLVFRDWDGGPYPILRPLTTPTSR